MENIKDTKPYFNVVKNGYDKDLQREQVQINVEQNCDIFLIKTDEGFIVDVYSGGGLLDSITIFNDEINLEDNS